MTEEEIYNHPEFKLAKKILKREFKWIKDLRLDGDPNRYERLIFLDIIMNPFECAEIEGLNVAYYVTKNKPNDVSIFSVFFAENSDNPIIQNIIKEIDKVFIDVNKSPALPDEYKMKDKRQFTHGMFSYLG
jgi:hypothetical protein